jgi:hypothetical protein
MNIASDGEGMFIICCISRRLKKKATRRKYSIHPYFKISGDWAVLLKSGNYRISRSIRRAGP